MNIKLLGLVAASMFVASQGVVYADEMPKEVKNETQQIMKVKQEEKRLNSEKENKLDNEQEQQEQQEQEYNDKEEKEKENKNNDELDKEKCNKDKPNEENQMDKKNKKNSRKNKTYKEIIENPKTSDRNSIFTYIASSFISLNISLKKIKKKNNFFLKKQSTLYNY